MTSNDASNVGYVTTSTKRRPFSAASTADSNISKLPMPSSRDAPSYEERYAYQFLTNLLGHAKKADVKPDEIAHQILAYTSPKLSHLVDQVGFQTVFTQGHTDCTWDKAAQEFIDFFSNADEPPELMLDQILANVWLLAARPDFSSQFRG
jgi:hypothetical protein